MSLKRNLLGATFFSFALAASFLSPQYVQAAPNCLAAPKLDSTPDGNWTPAAGISVKTWNFARGVSHNGPEATRVSVASTSLVNYDLKMMHDGFPNYSDPYEQLPANDAYVAINADFFDLYWPTFLWGPVINQSVVEYLPLTEVDGVWKREWLKVVGTTDDLPNPENGYVTTGSLQTQWQEVALTGTNLKALAKNAAVVYDSSFVGKTPAGEATIVISGGKVVSNYPNGISISIPANSRVIQATGTKADLLRQVAVEPTVALTIAGPVDRGFATTGNLNAAGKKTPVVGINLAKLKTGATVFDSNWPKPKTPRGNLTWVLKNGKVNKVFSSGTTQAPAPGSKIVQFMKPAAAVKKVKVGTAVKIQTQPLSTSPGYITNGTIAAAAGQIPVAAINLETASATGAVVYDDNWQTPTLPGAVTITIQAGKVIEVDADGSDKVPGENQIVIQVPAAHAELARDFATFTSAKVTLNPPKNLVRTLTSTLLRSSGKVTVGSDVIPIGALNHNRIAADYATVFNRHWRGVDGDLLTKRGNSTVVVRDGVISEVYPIGVQSKVSQNSTVIQFPLKYREVISTWAVGTPIDIDIIVQTHNKKKLISTLGRGRSNLTDGEVVAPCGPDTDGVRPRTSIGWNKAGQIWLITASPTGSGLSNDGYRDGGGTVHQMADWLKQLGATDAVSFDGGGSTWMLRSTANGPQRVDMADPGPYSDPWIRWVPIAVGIVDRSS